MKKTSYIKTASNARTANIVLIHIKKKYDKFCKKSDSRNERPEAFFSANEDP